MWRARQQGKRGIRMWPNNWGCLGRENIHILAVGGNTAGHIINARLYLFLPRRLVRLVS